MYDRAAKADPSHANNLSNYGLFLSDVMGNAAEAEAMYKAALEAEPDHANAAYNYAVLLDSALRDVPRAEAMYRRVLGGDPKHAYALYNLAVLLEELEHRDQLGPDRDPGEVLSLYERAVKAAPKDALSAADLGRYLLTKVKDLDGAEAMLARSLQLDPNNSVALYNMGLLLVDKKQDAGAATKLWKKLKKGARIVCYLGSGLDEGDVEEGDGAHPQVAREPLAAERLEVARRALGGEVGDALERADAAVGRDAAEGLVAVLGLGLPPPEVHELSPSLSWNSPGAHSEQLCAPAME